MRKMKRAALALALSAALLLSGCGQVFDKDYLVESSYAPVVQSGDESGRITVRNLSELRQTILNLVTGGATEGQIAFDSAYEGDVAEDMASACWQVRTQDPFCAYCVENIAYELNKILGITEARVSVSYTEAGLHPESIQRLQVVTGVESLIRQALSQGEEKLTILINRSTYSAETMGDLVRKVYQESPAVTPREPDVTVNMFSGSGNRRLYELKFNYGMDAEELTAKQEELKDLDPFAEVDLSSLDTAHRALIACQYLRDNCSVSNSTQLSSAYDALIGGEANSEGIALAYVELCLRLGLSCEIVYGQKDWTPACWNIISLEGGHYHVDLVSCMATGLQDGFLLGDEAAWSSRRWDVSAYPRCTDSLVLDELFPVLQENDLGEEEAPSEEGEENPSSEDAENNT